MAQAQILSAPQSYRIVKVSMKTKQPYRTVTFFGPESRLNLLLLCWKLYTVVIRCSVVLSRELLLEIGQLTHFFSHLR
ncbi:hypothetical protein evm_007100 [Chilo suppressalis]|nr:hypothetical protein evm_007100 [Chilo suppressalis]